MEEAITPEKATTIQTTQVITLEVTMEAITLKEVTIQTIILEEVTIQTITLEVTMEAIILEVTTLEEVTIIQTSLVTTLEARTQEVTTPEEVISLEEVSASHHTQANLYHVGAKMTAMVLDASVARIRVQFHLAIQTALHTTLAATHSQTIQTTQITTHRAAI